MADCLELLRKFEYFFN